MAVDCGSKGPLLIIGYLIHLYPTKPLPSLPLSLSLLPRPPHRQTLHIIRMRE